mgnify:CR=1 FL=1
MKIKYCPSCLKPGYETFCKPCREKLFGGIKVSHILNFSKPEYEQKIILSTGKISISGVQPKHSLKLNGNTLELTEKGGEYILKPHPNALMANVKQVPANEHLTMQIASQVFGIDAAYNSILFFKDSLEPCYITKRFDRKSDGTKINLEDFSQITGKTEEINGTNYKYDSSYEEISDVIKKYCSAYKIEFEKFFKLILFNYLINNGDAHLKNFSLIRNDYFSDYILSPAYDLLNTRLHFPEESEMALELFKDGYETQSYKVNNHYLYADFFEFGIKSGMNKKRINKFISDIISKFKEIETLINHSFLNRESKLLYIEHVGLSMKKLSSQ